MIEPILPPVIISIAITSVYRTMALWIPATVVLRSWATVAIETFITELSSAIRNCPAHNASRTVLAPCSARALLASETSDERPIERPASTHRREDSPPRWGDCESHGLRIVHRTLPGPLATIVSRVSAELERITRRARTE